MKAFKIWRVREAVCGKPDSVPYRLRGWGGSNSNVADASRPPRSAWPG
jgi:hypothetical protein